MKKTINWKYLAGDVKKEMGNRTGDPRWNHADHYWWNDFLVGSDSRATFAFRSNFSLHSMHEEDSLIP